MITYFIIIYILFIASFFENNKLIRYIILLVLILFAGLRSPFVDHDYLYYLSYFNKINNGFHVNVEPSFQAISLFIHYFFSNSIFLFIVYASLSILLKYFALKKITDFVLFTFTIYFSYYFLLHEMTQIRISVSCGFILFSLPFLKERNYIVFFALLSIAVLFHYSAIVAILLLLFKNEKIERVFYFLIPLSYVVYFLNLDYLYLLEYFKFDYIALKLTSYREKSIIENVNVFNYLDLARILFAYILLFFSNNLQSKNNYSALLIKMYVFSITCLILLADNPTLAFRVRDIFGFVEPILLSFLVYLFSSRSKPYVTVAIFIMALFILSIALFYDNLLRTYSIFVLH